MQFRHSSGISQCTQSDQLMGLPVHFRASLHPLDRQQPVVCFDPRSYWLLKLQACLLCLVSAVWMVAW